MGRGFACRHLAWLAFVAGCARELDTDSPKDTADTAGSAGGAGVESAPHASDAGRAADPNVGTAGGAGARSADNPGRTDSSTAGHSGDTGSGGRAASGGANAVTGGTGASAGASATAGSGSNAGSSAVSYPKLDPSAIGAPLPIAVDVTPALSLAESPLWDRCGQQLLFTDVNASRIYALKDDRVTTFASNTSNTNGMAFDLDGSLILAQMGPYPGHLARRDKSGTIAVIEPAGSPILHTPDDVVVRSDGMIFFTDGEFGPIGLLNLTRLPVYTLAPGGTMLVSRTRLQGPNGIEFSPDEHTLYIDSFFDGSVMKYDVADDGSLMNGTAFAIGLSKPDSLCLDAAGNLYIGVAAGIQVLDPSGREVALIPIPSSSGTTNCTFGDDTGTTLYITAWTTLWKVPGMPIPGLDWTNHQTRIACAGQ